MKAILACDKSGGIGLGGSLPWPPNPVDLNRFKSLTSGSSVVMGRGTWASNGMPKPLPGRKNYVVTSASLDVPDDVSLLSSVEEVRQSDIEWCIGGAGLFHSLMPEFDEIHLSVMRRSFEADTFIDLDQIQQHFTCVRNQLCLTHNYQIWVNHANLP